MKIAIHLTERVMFCYPMEYWVELVRKLIDRGHEIYAFSDEPNVASEYKNEHFHSRLHLPEAKARKAMSECDLFIGVPLRYYGMAKELGIRTIGILGSTFKGEGVRTTNVCGGCLDKLSNKTDCIFQDEICYWEVTPADILNAI